MKHFTYVIVSICADSVLHALLVSVNLAFIDLYFWRKVGRLNNLSSVLLAIRHLDFSDLLIRALVLDLLLLGVISNGGWCAAIVPLPLFGLFWLDAFAFLLLGRRSGSRWSDVVGRTVTDVNESLTGAYALHHLHDLRLGARLRLELHVV